MMQQQPQLQVRLSRRRTLAAFGVAAISDVLSVVLEFLPPAQIAVDVATAAALWAILGWRWPLLPALVAEAMPGLGLFPTWTLVAGAYVVYGGSLTRRLPGTGRTASR